VQTDTAGLRTKRRTNAQQHLQEIGGSVVNEALCFESSFWWQTVFVSEIGDSLVVDHLISFISDHNFSLVSNSFRNNLTISRFGFQLFI